MVMTTARSPYRRGKRLLLISILCAVAIVWGIPIAATILGIGFDYFKWIVGPLVVAWLLFFGISSMLLVCPCCGRSLFMRGSFLIVPWPAKTCGKCDTDLTVNQ